jgi:hypothetical protein
MGGTWPAARDNGRPIGIEVLADAAGHIQSYKKFYNYIKSKLL